LQQNPSSRFAKIEGSDPEAVVVKFFGIFFFFFQCNAIFGNIISTAVLSSGNDAYVELSDAQMAMCGSQFCPQASAPAVVEDETLLAPLVGGLLNATLVAAADEAETGHDNFKTATWKIYIIAGIYLACSISAAILIALFVDPLDRFGTTDEKKEKPKLSGMQLLMATFKQMKRKEQLLIIPITFWSGIEQGFFGADFTAVSKVLRLWHYYETYPIYRVLSRVPTACTLSARSSLSLESATPLPPSSPDSSSRWSADCPFSSSALASTC
jgi:hypothetical protein